MPAWTHEVTLNAVDITDRTASGLTVEESENASHLCDFVYYPVSGVQDSDSLILQPIQVRADVGSGFVTIFSGVVIRAVWVPENRSYRIRGSNRLQEHFRSLGSIAAVLAALPGARYSDAIFGEPPEDLWEYAERCLETLEQDAHLDRAGALVLIDWAAKVTPDHILSKSEIHNAGAFELNRVDADQIINRAVVEYHYRVQRFKVRKHSISWSGFNNSVGITNWCQWLVGPTSAFRFGLPTKTMVEQAFTGGSWNVPGPISMSTHPDSIQNPCGTTGFWVNNTLEGDYPVWSVGVDGFRGFASSIWEKYTLTFDAIEAQAGYGSVVAQSKEGSLDVPADPDWPPSDAQPQSGWPQDAIFDFYEDQADEANRVNDLETARQWAGWQIRGSNRLHTVTVRTDLRPDITLEDTVEAQANDMTAKGKIRRIRYVLDSAGPYTEIGIAISRGFGGTNAPWTVPARPDSQPGYPAPPTSQTYLTYLGGYPGAPPVPSPDERLGWVNNVGGPAKDGTNLVDPAFRIEWPEIEQEAVDEVEALASSSYELSVPHDILVLS